ncbi:integral membrane protein [Catenulispora acidiphila DSM 44928]|uniref:Integral membrane protein n=1 Tax=Catenulispora acidiphila (strain DSM 44928 / JCM 14897 / NBRC 102108 / NRRL B-24433 / ID139908) TaxID=479433 RepID=C7QET1_CATAD|nr:hypothetical protein [Catenulispora acidiphila]ACU72851.1 integral membrane protein [Catenulispora acidiphila DSM 44928]
MPFLPIVLRAVAAAGLAVDAGIHLNLAHRYDPVTSSVISQGTLFRIEAAAAIAAAVLVVLWRRRPGDAFAWLTAAAGLAAILLYRYANPGAIGPLPDMYEPIWYADKVWALISQAAAVATLTPLIIRPHRIGAKAPTAG